MSSLISHLGLVGLSGLTFSISGVAPAIAEPAKRNPCNPLSAPASLSLRESGMDRPRSACASNSFSIGTRASALIDTPNFYGTVSASLFLDWHFVHRTGFEFGVGAKMLDARFVQSAVFTDTEFNVGPLYLTIAKPKPKTWWGKPVVVSHALRLNIPVTTTSDENLTVSASPSLSASLSLTRSLDLHSRLSALLWSTLPKSGADSRTAVQSSIDLGYSPASFLSLLVGGEAQGGWYGLGLDHLQARAGLRVSAGSTGAIELSAAQVLAGEEGAALVVWLGYKTSALPKSKKKSKKLKDFFGISP